MNITSFGIRNFRALQDLKLEGLKRVNLIAGANNMGKTGLLEALWLFSGPDSPNIGLRLDQFRGINVVDPDELLLDLFHEYDAANPIKLRATGDWGSERRELRIETRTRETSRIPVQRNGQNGDLMPPLGGSPHEIVLHYEDGASDYESSGWFGIRQTAPGVGQGEFEERRHQIADHPVSHYFSPRHRNLPQEDANRLGRMELQGMDELITEILKPFEPRLRRLTTISINGVPMVHADVGQRRLMPAGLLGDGFQRVLSLALVFQTALGGMVLVDEIENGIHHSRLMDLWRAINLFSEKFSVQVFATTHSQECARAAHLAFSEAEKYDFRFFRLDRVEGRIKAKVFDEVTLGTALDAHLELR